MEELEALRGSRGYVELLCGHLKSEIQTALGQVHDYRQLVTQIIQNMNVIAERAHPSMPVDESLPLIGHEEMAIYQAARLMEQKLQAALFFVHPEKINDPADSENIRIHGLVIKYRKIYSHAFDAKGLRIIETGESLGGMWGNGDALGVIPQTFIDNAYKYSPRGERVELSFHEDEHWIEFVVSSFGPRIDDDERQRIFEPFYRGRNATVGTGEGTGFGLALSQLVADRCGVEITFTQNPQRASGTLLWTSFKARFPRSRRPPSPPIRPRDGRIRRSA
jgi:signal transduction histidine kinase